MLAGRLSDKMSSELGYHLGDSRVVFFVFGRTVIDSKVFETLSPKKYFSLCHTIYDNNGFGALYQIADGLFVGRFIGSDALAAGNLIMPIIMIVFGFANLIATGASVRISVLLGEKNREEASRVFTFTLKVIFLIPAYLAFQVLYLQRCLYDFWH